MEADREQDEAESDDVHELSSHAQDFKVNNLAQALLSRQHQRPLALNNGCAQEEQEPNAKRNHSQLERNSEKERESRWYRVPVQEQGAILQPVAGLSKRQQLADQLPRSVAAA